MRCFSLLLLLLLAVASRAQTGLAFIRFSTEDGTGLASNMVTSLYQDEKGFIWTGTANGLQRFDGRKFIQLGSDKAGSDPMPFSAVAQIVPAGNGLIVSYPSLREFGIFYPSTFVYKKIALKPSRQVTPRSEFRLVRFSDGTVLLNIGGMELLQFDSTTNAFVPHRRFAVPRNWRIGLGGIFEDKTRRQVWLGTDSGIVIFDQATRQTWTRHHNPRRLPILENSRIQDRISEVYIDRQRRIWVFGWPSWGTHGQYKFCLDSTGSRYLNQDTLGLNGRVPGYTEYHALYETRDSTLWVYGLNVLLSYDRTAKRFALHQAQGNLPNLSVDYQAVHQVMQDRDGSLWVATDKGLYFAAYGDDDQSTMNLIMGQTKQQINISDILQMPNGDYWFACWGAGIKVISPDMQVKPLDVFRQRPPAGMGEIAQTETKLLWTLCRQSSTGHVWMGSNSGFLMIYDPVRGTTQYTRPPACGGSTIRFIVEDKKGRIWLGTQSGRLVKWEAGVFTVVQEIGTIIYKIFIDRQGLLWLATHEKGLMAIDPDTGKLRQHYTAGPNRLYSNTGNDIEQLNDSIIVYGANALNFINKKTGQVRILGYGQGLPSNTVSRLRMDSNGYLWIITTNGLCRYNPANNRITPYGRKDGIMLAEQTTASDLRATNGNLLFAGNNAMIMFDPNNYLNSQSPPDVTITDFRLFNQYLPADSLLQLPQVKLKAEQNSFSIYFSSISFVQRDKMAYYYKMEGVDKEWIQSDVSKLVSYSLLPPGHYTFKVYCETIEGIRSKGITELSFFIQPPFWKTKWFLSCVLFLIALAIYAIHNLRVNRLLAVEKLRNRVARDLHDDMGSTLSTINILSSMAKTKMSTDAVKTSEYLSKISDNSQRMMEAMDDIVWSIKPSNDSMQRVTARMREFATNVLEAKDIDLAFVVQEEVYDVKLNMEARRDFFLVFKEAVNNAAKYSKADKVTVKISQYKRMLVLVVQDNGRGFDVEQADGGNGLGNMQKRADSMNGRVRIASRPGSGTTVTVSVPVQ